MYNATDERFLLSHRFCQTLLGPAKFVKTLQD